MSSRLGRKLRLKGRRDPRALAELARAQGMDLVPRTVYSPVPRVPAEGDPVWEARSDLPGLAIDAGESLRFAREELADGLGEFDPPHGPAPGAFGLLNPYYGPVDAHLLYAMVRAHGPARVLELGSGYSSLVIAEALERNGAEGRPGSSTVVDPHPRDDLAAAIGSVAQLERTDAAGLPAERFTELAAGDLLFVDSSHVVKLGGEVNHVVLEMLPRLAPGVLVHFHDIFLPYEYPRPFFARGEYLSEQYLLQAYLAENPNWEILFAAHAAWRERRGELEQLIPTTRLRTTGPAAFWMRRRAR